MGPTDSGKSTLSKMLLSWAAKQGWKPTFVDLDIGQGAITIPGCIAATPIEMPIDPVEGIPLDMPLVYFYGHTTPTYVSDLVFSVSIRICQGRMVSQTVEFYGSYTSVISDMLRCYSSFQLLSVVFFRTNVDLYRVLVKELSQMVEKQLAGTAESQAAGLVINTMGWIEGAGYEVL